MWRHYKRIKFLEYELLDTSNSSTLVYVWYSNNSIRPIKIRKFIVRTWKERKSNEYVHFESNDFLTEGNYNKVSLNIEEIITSNDLHKFVLIDSVNKKYTGYVYKDKIFSSHILGFLFWLLYRIRVMD